MSDANWPGPTHPDQMHHDDPLVASGMYNPGAPLLPLPDEMRSAMRSEMNRGLMVSWINADLLNRASHDVRSSFVLYDEAGLFQWALDRLPGTDMCQRLHDEADVRYWSKGIDA